MEYDEETLKTILIEHTITGQEIKLIVSRDGLHLASHGLKEEEEDTFSAMCATMYGAGETAYFATDREIPEYIELFSKNSRLLLIGAGEQSLIAVMVSSDTPKKSALAVIKKIADEVGKIETNG
jgi:uncharacterized protein